MNAVADVEALIRFARRHPRLFVLTGAGVSTDSGIPDYRDELGAWKRRQPIRYREFLSIESLRRRYWARSLIGWGFFAGAEPNGAHRALARLERQGRLLQLVTQNVDGLHQQAGARRVIDLHGRVDRVDCLGCGRAVARDAYQRVLETANPGFAARLVGVAPDGDADLESRDYGDFRVPACDACGGVMKPAVVFFGESVPRPRVQRALQRLRAADGVLVVGSSLMVYSGYRFVRAAAELAKPVAAVNLGVTRADDLLTIKVSRPCAETLSTLASALGPVSVQGPVA
jgi:NAD-dependent SIR2 family protein deacetylase